MMGNKTDIQRTDETGPIETEVTAVLRQWEDSGEQVSFGGTMTWVRQDGTDSHTSDDRVHQGTVFGVRPEQGRVHFSACQFFCWVDNSEWTSASKTEVRWEGTAPSGNRYSRWIRCEEVDEEASA